MDLAAIYAPVQEDLDLLHALLERELAADDPFVSELVRHVLSTRGKMVRPALVCLSAGASGGGGGAPRWVPPAGLRLFPGAPLPHVINFESGGPRGGVPADGARGEPECPPPR